MNCSDHCMPIREQRCAKSRLDDNRLLPYCCRMLRVVVVVVVLFLFFVAVVVWLVGWLVGWLVVVFLVVVVLHVCFCFGVCGGGGKRGGGGCLYVAVWCKLLTYVVILIMITS